MATQIVFETHAWSEDNEHNVASGWRGSHLSARGHVLVGELGARRGNDGIHTVFTSDLNGQRKRRKSPLPKLRCRSCTIGGCASVIMVR